jgi:multiple sugar transport system ATP-binding protein
MAGLILEHIDKIYPVAESKAGRKKKAGIPASPPAKAVSDFNLEIKDKEFIVLVGPSGCGKSTTLRMIAGLEEITAGKLYIDGALVNNVPSKDRDIAMVFQSYALYPHMTVFENMAFALKLRKMPGDEIRRRVSEAAKILELEEYLDRKPKALSGGQRQRVALGRAIVRKPKVFLMDEPLSNLDAKLRVTMRAEIAKLHKALQTTFIYVTHDQTEAMTMGDRIVVMKDGLIQQSGEPNDLYQKPCNKFTAEFIGSPQMNVFEATLRKEDKKIKLTVGEREITISDGQKGQKGDGPFCLVTSSVFEGDSMDVFAGVRPEDIYVEPENLTKFANGVLDASIEVKETLGSEIYLYTKIPGLKKTVLARVLSSYPAKMGDDIKLAINTKKIHLFDANTEKNLRLGR